MRKFFGYLLSLTFLSACFTPATSIKIEDDLLEADYYTKRNTAYIYRPRALAASLASNYISANNNDPEVLAMGEIIVLPLKSGTNIIQKVADINQRSYTMLIENVDGKPRYILNTSETRELQEYDYQTWLNKVTK